MNEKENVMLVPSENSFALSKCKILRDGGLDVHYEVTEVIGSESYTNKYHVESAKDIHPDLRNLFVKLRPIMGRVFNITSFLSMIENKEFGPSDNQVKIARDFSEECLKNIDVSGISLSGKDDNVGVVITGILKVSNNPKTAINSPRIKFNSTSFGFEEELNDIVADIESEVYKFLFKNKKAQLELFGSDGEASEDNNGSLFDDEENEND